MSVGGWEGGREREKGGGDMAVLTEQTIDQHHASLQAAQRHAISCLCVQEHAGCGLVTRASGHALWELWVMGVVSHTPCITLVCA